MYRLTLFVQDVLCAVNLQHDCHRSGCNDMTETRRVRQDYVLTARTRSVLMHKDTPFMVLNCHALHNYQYIAQALPPDLRRNEPYTSDRQSTIQLAVRQMVTAARKKKPATCENTTDHSLLPSNTAENTATQSTTIPDPLFGARGDCAVNPVSKHPDLMSI